MKDVVDCYRELNFRLTFTGIREAKVGEYISRAPHDLFATFHA